jgi:predicted AAA+ superfamily ATPase
MIKRALEAVLRQKIDHKKALLILGPRQVGKTTLTRQLAGNLGEEYLYFNGDDMITRTIWRNDQVAALKESFGHKKLIILDEAQMVEEVGIICKQLIDADMGIQLILTGSSSLHIADRTQEPLTGRKWEYFLYPISCGELLEHNGLPGLIRDLPLYLVYGTYPEVVTHRADAIPLLNNLCSSYLYKDVLALTGVKRPQLLEKILRALAWQVGSEVSLNELSKVVGADVKTIDNYIYLLEQVFVVYRLDAYSRNLRNEINTKKKIYFFDNGVRNALIADYTPLAGRNDTGALWENFLLSERKKLLAYHGFYGRTFFWRNKQQAEIDYIEEIDGKLYAYEFKWNPEVKVKFPQVFIETYRPVETKVIHRNNYWEWLKVYPY